MAGTSSFYDSKRVGKGQTPGAPSAADLDATGALLRHLEQLDTTRPDVATLVREIESAEAETLDEDGAFAARLLNRRGPATDASSATFQHSWHGAAKHALDARRTGHAPEPHMPTSAFSWDSRPSLTLPFLVVGVFIIAAVGAPVIRRARPAEPAAPLAARVNVTTHADAPAVTVPAGPTLTSDQQAVHAVVAAYADAYVRLDAAAVRAQFPSVDMAELQTAFASLRSLRVQLVNEQIQVNDSTATVACLWQLLTESSDGTARHTESPIVLTLQRQGQTWQIVNRY